MVAIREICRDALLGLLRPIVRFALKRSLKLREIVEYLKVVFVQIAKEELEKLNQEPTVSKLSAMTGIQRREINRLLDDGLEIKSDQDVIARVIGLWQSATKYKDKAGRPRILEMRGREGEFAELVGRVSSDLNPYTVAFELERAGIAESSERGIKLVKAGYEPSGNTKEALRLLWQDSEDLHSAVCQNIFETPKTQNLHIKTEFDNIPLCKEREIRSWFLEKGTALQEEARKYLAQLDRDISPSAARQFPNEPSLRAVIGTFSFTNRRDPSKI